MFRALQRAAIYAVFLSAASTPALVFAVDPNPLESAYWRFEEGTSFSPVDHTIADPVLDSINENHLDAFSAAAAPTYAAYSGSEPPVTELKSGLPNTLALDFIRSPGANDDLITQFVDGDQGKGLAKNINNGIIASGGGFTIEAGSAFPERPKWAVGNFWAPEITYHNGRYYIYYVGRNQEGRLAVAVATSNTPQGPYEDHGQLIAQEAGSIDGMAFTDQANQRWLVWKEDGNSRDQPTPIWLQRLSADGLKLTGERREILRNDAEWEGSVVEGPFIVFRDGWYYLFYAGGACCGRECSYGVGVARARDLNGPWEKSPSNPILTDNSAWRCPGHGSVVQDTSGRDWFLYHAYSADTFVPTGREMLLDEIHWDKAGWPRLGSDGPSTRAVAPVGVAKRGTRSAFHEHFDGDRLQPGWLWPQERIPGRELASGMLLLKSPKSAGDDLLGAVVAKTCTSGQYRATTTVDLNQMNDATLAGIAAIGDLENGLGLAVDQNKAVVWQRKRGRQKISVEQTIDMPKKIHLRLSVEDGDQMNFAYSPDGKTWSPLGATFDGSYMPPWDRSIRIALTVGNIAGATAKFDGFAIESLQPEQSAK